MPEYLSPGVYVEEVDRGPKPIQGVGTAMPVFVGFTEKAQASRTVDGEKVYSDVLGRPQLVTNWTQFAETFGGVIDGAYQDLLQAFDSNGFTFYVGCAAGVDRSFRRALSQSPYQDHCFVACAFKYRTYPEYSYGLYASVVVPPNLPPVAALFRRTIWLVTRCAMVLLFPENHNNTWGKDSRLVFKSALFHLKPVFVVAENAPKESMHYRVLKSNLFGVVDGFWVVPHTYEQGGTCDEEY